MTALFVTAGLLTAGLLAGSGTAFVLDRRRPRYVGRHRDMF
ncbi:hypothetical protein [Actinomadura coerulea]